MESSICLADGAHRCVVARRPGERRAGQQRRAVPAELDGPGAAWFRQEPALRHGHLRGLSWATAAAGKARQDRTPLDEDFLLRQRAAQAARSFLQRRAAVAAGKPPRGSR